MDFPFWVIFTIPVLAVWLSFIFTWITKPKDKKNIKLLLAFSGAFLLALTFFELLPEIYESHQPKVVAICILVGILLQIFLEFFSKGAEHGHVHLDSKRSKFPLLLFLSLSIHALIEGVPIHGDNSIIYGIVIHKVPVAIILSIFLLNSNLKKSAVIIFIVAFSLMTPIGTYVAQTPFMNTYAYILYAMAIGVFLHISTIILFESSQGHSFNLQKLIVIILGIGIAYFI